VPEVHDRGEDRILLIHGGGARWALPLGRLIHVGVIGPLARIPDAPGSMCGIIAYRGDIVPVLDLGHLLGREEPDAKMVALVTRADQLIGLRFTAIDGIRGVEGNETEILDVDRFELPTPMARGAATEANGAHAIPGVSPRRRGLAIIIGGQTAWLPMVQILEIVADVTPIGVPWGDPRVPEVIVRGDDVLPVVRVDLLLHAAGKAEGPFVVAQLGLRRIAFRVDTIVGVAERGEVSHLPLEMLLTQLPGYEQDAIRRPARAAPVPEASYLAFSIGAQPCLLPLGEIGAVMAHTRPAALPAGELAGLVGVRAVRGHILPVVDQRAALGLEDHDPPLVDIVVVPREAPRFVLTANKVDGIVRLRADAVSGTGRGTMVAGLVRIGEVLTWLLAPRALMPMNRRAE
jgi:chemotaxis signal transduction protein